MLSAGVAQDRLFYFFFRNFQKKSSDFAFNLHLILVRKFLNFSNLWRNEKMIDFTIEKYGVMGVITGRAIYEGTLILSEAIKFAKKADK